MTTNTARPQQLEAVLTPDLETLRHRVDVPVPADADLSERVADAPV
ncbi:MAG: hypothetical protein K9N51_01735 [Candidatus Pacebacteria bacterium]|nr:hypothetical protein [Candidatus Paceibacterota bacterium]